MRFDIVQVLPPPFIPPLKGEGGFNLELHSLNSISGPTSQRKNMMFVSPSPWWGGIEGGGKPSLQYLNFVGEAHAL